MNNKDLLTMLTYKRPAGTRTEETFIKRYIDSIPDMIQDDYGNRILASPGSRTIIACHTDTVHWQEGRQKVRVVNNTVSLPLRSNSNCLGADDTAGVYAALRMIQAGVPVTYIFHRDEEIGGRGSAWLAKHYPEWLSNHDICLSLDRRGDKDIIVDQWGGRTASDAFALSLAGALDMGHAPANGIFTDSANYADLIPECSNISIGYQHEHSTKECLDLGYLGAVISKLITVDWEGLTIARVPGEPDPDAYTWPDEYVDEDGLVFSLTGKAGSWRS